MKSQFYVCYLSMGSNKDDRFAYLQKAVNLIEDDENIRLLNVSSVYETLPFGNLTQENFYNTAVEILTLLGPIDLLKRLKEIESEIGRSENEKWGPREIDLDIIFYDDIVIDEKELIIPHPGVYERDFFLIPLLELNDKLCDPKTGRRLNDFINKLKSKNIVKKLDKTLSYKERSI